MNIPDSNRWLVYQKERFPLGTYLVLAGGMAAQSVVLGHRSFATGLLMIGTVMAGLFFACLRLMDEVKDEAKDRVAHPERPLARGLIGVDEAKRVIHGGLSVMLGLGLLLSLSGHLGAGLLYGLTTVYLWLMYREFFVGPWLSARPLLYALSHQVILLPLLASMTALGLGDGPGGSDGGGILSLFIQVRLWVGGLLVLPAFFTYEVARKLSPDLHPLLAGYRTVFGLRGCQWILAALALGGVAAWINLIFVVDGGGMVIPWGAAWLGLGSAGFLAPLGISLWRGDQGAKGAETLATLNLTLAIYGPLALHFFGSLTRTLPGA